MKLKALFLVGALGLSATTQAHSADGCKFMLCMGAVHPMGIPECVGTIKDVLKDLRKGRGLPTCKMSNGVNSKEAGSWVEHHRASRIPKCPSGMKYGKDDIFYHKGKMPQNPSKDNIGSGSQNQLDFSDDKDIFLSTVSDRNYDSKVCVGKKLGEATIERVYHKNDSLYSRTETHEWYDKMQVMYPDNKYYNFKFYVDGKLFSEHRF